MRAPAGEAQVPRRIAGDVAVGPLEGDGRAQEPDDLFRHRHGGRSPSYNAPPAMTPAFVCSMCRKPIAVGGRVIRCSVSTCNSGKIKLVFCSPACWDSHLPN